MTPKTSGMKILSRRLPNGRAGWVTLSRLTATPGQHPGDHDQRPETAGGSELRPTAVVAAGGQRRDTVERGDGKASGNQAADEHDEIADRRDPAHEAGENRDHDQDRSENAHWSRRPAHSPGGAPTVTSGKGERRDQRDQRDPALPVDAVCLSRSRFTGAAPPMRHITTRSTMPTAGDQQRRREASRRPAPTTSGSTGCSRSRPGAWRRCRRPRRWAARATMAPTSAAATAIFIDTKRIGQRRRPAQLPEHLPAAGVVGAHQIEMDRLGRAQALHHADGDREEGQVGRDQRLRRCSAGDRVHLAASTTMTIGAIARMGIVCEEITHGIRLRSRLFTWTMPTASRMPSSVPDDEAEQGRGRASPRRGRAGSTAWSDWRRTMVVVSVDADLMRRRQRSASSGCQVCDDEFDRRSGRRRRAGRDRAGTGASSRNAPRYQMAMMARHDHDDGDEAAAEEARDDAAPRRSRVSARSPRSWAGSRHDGSKPLALAAAVPSPLAGEGHGDGYRQGRARTAQPPGCAGRPLPQGAEVSRRATHALSLPRKEGRGARSTAGLRSSRHSCDRRAGPGGHGARS